MLEFRLRSGQIVAFDGRIVEVFDARARSLRFHIAQLSLPEPAVAGDGARTVALENGAVTLSFTREEAPACARLLTALADSRAALEGPAHPRLA